MSTKKDKFLTKDKNYMRLAISLASARKGLTGNNPSEFQRILFIQLLIISPLYYFLPYIALLLEL